MAKREDPVELPEWFSLERYSVTSTFGAEEWLRCIDLRRQLLMGNPDYPQKAKLSAKERAAQLKQWQQKVSSPAAAVRRLPLRHTNSRKALITWGVDPALSCLFLDAGLKYAPPTISDAAIRPVNEGDICRYLLTDPESEVRAFIQQGFQGSVYGGTSSKDFKPSPMHPAIVINLNAKNADIEKAFKLWLKAERAKKAIQQPFYARWAEDQILPYLDLTIWAMEMDVKISDAQMEDTLFPEDAAEGGYPDKWEGKKTKARRALIDLPALRAAALKEGEL